MRWIKRLLVLAALPWGGNAPAVCSDTSFIDPVNDVVWDCIFPITIMGIPLDFGDHPPDTYDSTVLCECPEQGGIFNYGLGFEVTFWEPARMIETVNDPWCFPGLGQDMGVQHVGYGYTGAGMLEKDSIAEMAFQHYHYYIFPVWAMLSMFGDIPCLDSEDEGNFDLAMVSEVRPDWHDDFVAMQLYPETSLMKNVPVVLACVADAIASTFEFTIDPLYWCMGAWGTTYPMTGHITITDYVEANAGIAGKAMFVQSRMGLLPDRAVDYCSPQSIPIWIKSHWRIQEVDPIADDVCHTIGHPGLLWTYHKNPVGMQDNFTWMLFRKVNCCVEVF